MSQERFTPHALQLTRRMAPLAVLTFTVIGMLVPWLYQQSQEVELKREARFMARSIAARAQQLVARSPQLWPYYPQELSEMIAPFQNLGAQVECVTTWGISCAPLSQYSKIFTKNKLIKAQHPIIYRKQVVGYISVGVLNHTQSTPFNIWWITTPLALLVSGLIIALPWWAARSADLMNTLLWDKLIDLNQTLEQRVSVRTQELSEMNHRLITIQEEERLRMSRDLHDELGQTLTGLRLQLTCAEMINQHQQVDQVLKQALEIIDLGVDQVRRIAYEQRPPELDMLGLADALQALVTRANQQGAITISLSLPLNNKLDRLPIDLSVALFRVAQEGLTNALRHSNSNSIEVKISLSEHQVILEVIDHGVGDPNTVIWGGGLSGLHGRLHKLQGQLSINSTSSGGITLSANIPY